MSIITNTPLTLTYFIRDIAEALLTFDHMIWYRSRSGATGLYEIATDLAVGPATMTGATIGPHAVHGKSLIFKVNDVTTVTVPFSNVDPVSTTDVAIAINAATLLVIATADSNDRLVLTSVTTGSLASIEIVASDAAPYLGFNTGDAAIGLDLNSVLVNGTHQYFYTDNNSDLSFFYKIQLLNVTTLRVSELSVPIPADQTQGLPYSTRITASIRLASLTGRPVANRKVTIANVFLPNRKNGFGIFRTYEEIFTDVTGYAEIWLTRGAVVDVTVEGTGFVRRITVPTTGDFVDLLDPALVSNDEFGIQEQNIDFAIRTS